ncbi:structural maintenance of chromosomes protein 6 [Schistocerca piceifrons]|uniref:structural maintenance of chromosomes protein 6 n=1 Tax=Schistocerca piceifrons TaxID=274613 RepID=UPI001F5F48E4|nr:structural maintenance of chromosomes protein 6 [Schistocerca piceifrons]XP_047117571.1 structural maintenance of chromosomes protein 6 [Schistocerca piceifrons]
MNREKRHKSKEETDAVSAKRRRTNYEANEADCSDDGYESNVSQQSQSIQKLEVPGTIAKIHLKNFMCHANLEVDLNPRINFIVGRNGSGKSAILTGVILALGGNASATNRASSVKDFVRKGATTASVEITINNKGVRAYKPEEYGNMIIICRTLSAVSGQSTYRIRSARGEVKSSKKEELDRIVSHLNIQVNNPISVLNQDTARTFLSNSDPAEKYKLFKKATQLQAIEDTYQNTIKSLEEAKRIYQQKRKAADALKAEIKDLKKRCDYYNSMANHDKKMRLLENELMWSLAIREENLYKQLQNDLQAEIAKCPDMRKGIEKYQSEAEELVDINRGFISELSSVEQDEAEILGKLNSAKETEKAQNQSASQIYKLYKQKESLKKRLEVDIKTLQQEIMKITNMNGVDYAAEKKKQAEKIIRLEHEGEQIDARIKTADFDYQQLRSAISCYVSDQQSLKAEEREILQQIEAKKRQVRALEREDRDVISLYGSWMPSFLAKIDELHRNGKFDRKPVGPIGAYIKLKDSSWAPAIENFLGARFLSSFCVHNAKDSRVLSSLINSMRIDRPPNILIGKFFDRVHNVQRNGVVAPGYTSLLGALIISNPIIANCVIDKHRAESVLLIPTSDEAHRLMSRQENVPHNCQRAFTKRGDLYFPDPNYKSYAGSGSDRAKVLQVNMSDVIRNVKEELIALESKMKDVQLQLHSMNKKVQEEQQQLQKINDVRNSLSREKLNISKELSNLKNSVEPESSSLSTLTEELEDINKRFSMVQKECNKLKEEYEELMAEVEKSKNVIRSLQAENQQIISAGTSLKEKISANENLIQSANMKLKALEKNYETHLAKIKHMETDLKTRELKCKTAVEKANELCPRMVTNRSSHAINDELTNIKEYIRNFEQQEKSTKEEIVKALNEKTAKFSEIDVNVSRLEKAFERFPAIIESRNFFLDWLKKYVIIRVQCFFYGILLTRKYTGKIEVDDVAGKMYVRASPSATGKDENQMVGKDVKSLSGGERSFSTVGLILSLWAVAEPPFYFLDEFDVFMDKVNRQIVMDLLLFHANSNGFQYVFLTPQDTSSVKTGKDLTIHWLEAPKRGNCL